MLADPVKELVMESIIQNHFLGVQKVMKAISTISNLLLFGI